MIINHHNYNIRTKENDLSLLKLQHPLVFNRFVRPIDIWMSPLSPFRMCTITGWGATQESECVDIRKEIVDVNCDCSVVVLQMVLGFTDSRRSM